MNQVISTEAAKPNGFSLFSQPETFEAAKAAAELLSKSDLVPKSYQGRSGDILIAGSMGARLGLDIFSSLAGIAVVNGRATLYGDALLAVIQGRADFENIEETWTGVDDGRKALCVITRKGRSPYHSEFSVSMAKTAGLWKKQGPWTQYPDRMLMMRARALAIRGSFADALAGITMREEAEDIEPREIQGTVIPEAKPAKRRIIKEALAVQEHPDDFQPHDVPPALGDVAQAANPAPPGTTMEPSPASPTPYTDVELLQECNSAVESLGKPEAERCIKEICAGLGVKNVREIPMSLRAQAVLAIREAYGK